MHRSYKRRRFLEAAATDAPRTEAHYHPQREWAMTNGFIDENSRLTDAGAKELARYNVPEPVCPARGVRKKRRYFTELRCTR